MDNENLKQLYDAIKTDNVFRFGVFAKNKSDLSVCYGRFPVLSLCYLYKSYRILDLYEDSLLTIKKYTIVDEYFEIYLEFKKYAKKSIRLYIHGEIVSPLEMLSIVDDRNKIAKSYKKYEKNDDICRKIKKIYSLSHKTDVEIDTKGFKAPSKNLEKKTRLFYIVVASILSFMIIFPAFSMLLININSGLGTASSPIHIETENEFYKAIGKGNKNYILNNDIVLTKSINIENFSGSIDGNGKTIYSSDFLVSPMIKNLTGTIKNLKLEVKHNNLEIIKNTAFFAEISSGIIKNCEISGYINGEFKNSEDSYLSMFVNQNDGTIENSIANISAEITNSSSTNAFLSSFSSVNNGKIVACKSTNLSYLVDTIDLACFAIDNNGSIEKCENNLELSQTSSSLWHPNTAGICIDNNGTIKDTANNGDISSSSTNTTSSNEQNDRFVIYASGCSISNNGTVSNVINNGKISATSLVAETYSSGIIVHNNKELVDVTNNGDIFASSDSSNIYVSGITCYNSFTYKITEQGLMSYFEFINTSSILRATNNGNIEATSKIEIENNQTIISNIGVYAGGISAYNFTHIDSSINNGDIKCDSKSATIYAGGLTGYANYHSSFSPHLTYVISNSVSKSTISVTSSLSVTFVGGVTGYGVQTKIIKSGFEGKMTTNAVESYAGGIAGSYKAPDSIYSNNATISDCYASVSFDNQAVKSFYGAGIVGFYNTVYNIYASNNAYYSGADVPSMYLVDLNTGELTGYGAEDTGATKFNSHQELLNFIYGEAK